MPNNVFLVLALVFMFAAIIQSYHMGWENGHDAGHDHQGHTPPPEPPTDTPIWR